MKILILLFLLTACVSNKSIHQQKLDTQWNIMLKHDKHMRRKMHHTRKRATPHHKQSKLKYKRKYNI